MIEVLKQALEALKDVGVLTDREWQAVHKNKANELRQAIAKLESQNHIEQHLKMGNQLSAAQRNELLQIEDGTWEADRNG